MRVLVVSESQLAQLGLGALVEQAEGLEVAAAVPPAGAAQASRTSARTPSSWMRAEADRRSEKCWRSLATVRASPCCSWVTRRPPLTRSRAAPPGSCRLVLDPRS